MNHEWLLNDVQNDYFCKHCGVYAKNDAAYYATCIFTGQDTRDDVDEEILRQLGHHLKED